MYKVNMTGPHRIVDHRFRSVFAFVLIYRSYSSVSTEEETTWFSLVSDDCSVNFSYDVVSESSIHAV